jgi:hypothetical protein
VRSTTFLFITLCTSVQFLRQKRTRSSLNGNGFMPERARAHAPAASTSAPPRLPRPARHPSHVIFPGCPRLEASWNLPVPRPGPPFAPDRAHAAHRADRRSVRGFPLFVPIQRRHLRHRRHEHADHLFKRCPSPSCVCHAHSRSCPLHRATMAAAVQLSIPRPYSAIRPS